MSTGTTTTTVTPAPTPAPAPANPIHQALDWAKQKSVDLLHALSGISISKPAAEVAAVAEEVFRAALPEILAAEEQTVAALVSTSQYQVLAQLVGEINAAVVKQWLATIAVTPAAPAIPTTTPKAP